MFCNMAIESARADKDRICLHEVGVVETVEVVHIPSIVTRCFG